MIDGYTILRLIGKKKAYNEETARAVRCIQANNMAYIRLLGDVFWVYDNIVLPLQVKKELEHWIEPADIGGYEKWIDGEKKPFHSKARNSLAQIRSENPYFAPVFNAPYEYKKAVRKFLEGIPNEQVADYSGDERLPEIIQQSRGIEEANDDKQVFRSSYLATSDRMDAALKIISFDGSMARIAKTFDKIGLGNGIEVNIHGWYSLVRYSSAKRIIAVRFDLVYPRVPVIQAA